MTPSADQYIPPCEASRWSAPLWAVVDTALVFGALGWLYVATIASFHPGELPTAIESWIPVRRDTFGIICFGLSAVAYFFRQLRKTWVGVTTPESTVLVDPGAD